MQRKITEIVKKCLLKRQKPLKDTGLEAYRLLDVGESILQIAVDIYNDNAVIHLFGPFHSLSELEVTLRQLLNIKHFFYKNRTKNDSSLRADVVLSKNDLKLPQSPQKELIIREYGHKFWCNLSDYLDTGLFLDHRETRKWIQNESKNKTVLNTFAYTGSFSIYAAKGGAQKTYSVDLSKTYCDWIKKNLELNKLPADRNWVYKMDTREFFQYAKRKNLKFDIIIIDPPSFSRNKGSSFSVQKDHPQLINDALEILNPKGFILFSNNKQDFRLHKEKLSPCIIQNIQRQTIPEDFTNRNAHYCFVIKNI